MITVTEQPPAIASTSVPTQPPVPLSDCIKFCLQPDTADAITTPGAQATVVITIPATCTVPADGTTFKIWGYDFTVDSAQDFTGNSFKVNSVGVYTWLNLGNMLLGNLFFQRNTIMTGAIVGPNFTVTLTWRECREQPRFASPNMALTVFTTIGGGAVVTNGISPAYVDAFRLVTSVVAWTDATDATTQISALVGLESEKQCSTVGETCVSINSDIEPELYTILPALTSTSFISAVDNGRSMMKLFSLLYGWTYREDCISKSGTFKKSDRVLVLNAAFDIDDEYQMRRYWYGHPDGLPPGASVVEFLTTQPKTLQLCKNSFKWLWITNNWQDDYGSYQLVASFAVYDLNGAIIDVYTYVINDPVTMGHSWYQVVNFNVSPQFLVDAFAVNLDNISKYEVNVLGTEVGDEENVIFNASEYLTFTIGGDCCGDGNTDVYFLNPPGGIDTVPVRIDQITALQSFQEVQTNVPCDAARADRAAYGGRGITKVRSYQKYKVSTTAPSTAEYQRWFKALRSSPEWWIKTIDASGVPLAKKIIFEAGSITVMEVGTGINIEMTGYLVDTPVQPGTEKRLF